MASGADAEHVHGMPHAELANHVVQAEQWSWQTEQLGNLGGAMELAGRSGGGPPHGQRPCCGGRRKTNLHGTAAAQRVEILARSPRNRDTPPSTRSGNSFSLWPSSMTSRSMLKWRAAPVNSWTRRLPAGEDMQFSETSR